MFENKKLSLNIIAPSSKISNQDLQSCLNALKKMQIDYFVSKPLFSSKELCSNSKEKRFRDFKISVNNANEYIWCLRGGYGCLHLVPEILKLQKPKQFKKLIGFSDISVLHYILNTEWNWPSLHWRHLNSFLEENKKTNKKAFDFDSFKKSMQILETKKSFNYIIKPLNSKAKNVTKINASIVGGNLITLQSLIGLNLAKPKGHILFLEEIDEPVYKIDRALTQLEQNDWFKNIKAIILGTFTNKNLKIEKEIKSYFRVKAETYSFPLFGGLKSGHIKDQKPLFFNTKSLIKKTSSGFILENKNGFI